MPHYLRHSPRTNFFIYSVRIEPHNSTSPRKIPTTCVAEKQGNRKDAWTTLPPEFVSDHHVWHVSLALSIVFWVPLHRQYFFFHTPTNSHFLFSWKLMCLSILSTCIYTAFISQGTTVVFPSITFIVASNEIQQSALPYEQADYSKNVLVTPVEFCCCWWRPTPVCRTCWHVHPFLAAKDA